MIGRVIPQPTSPAVIRPGTANRTEHVSTYNPGADIGEASGGKVIVNTARSSLMVTHLLERGGGESAFMECLSANSQRIVQTLLQTGTKTVN